jgi:predicted DNA-binding protein
MSDKPISVRIPAEELAAIRAQATEEKSTTTTIIRRACEMYIERYRQWIEFNAQKRRRK